MSVKDATVHRCIYCNVIFGSALSLHQHKQLRHGNRKNMKCMYEGCNFETSASGAMKIHVEKDHLRLRLYACKFCDYAAEKEGTLRYHIKRKHEEQYVAENLSKNCTVFRNTQDDDTREKQKSFLRDELKRYNYCNVLTVGEMDFSFSLSLGKFLKSKHSSGTSFSLTCSSYIELDQFRTTRINKKANANMRNLSNKIDATVYTGVDATMLHVDKRLMGKEYDLIIFNFPRASTMTGVTNENANLMLNFFLSAKQKLCLSRPTGDHSDHRSAIVILMHCCIIDGVPSDQYVEWGLDSIVKKSGLRHVGSFPFDNKDFPHYQPRSRLGKAFKMDKAHFHILVPAFGKVADVGNFVERFNVNVKYDELSSRLAIYSGT